jgi:hypothetical protein
MAANSVFMLALVPYRDLSNDEKCAVHDWLTEHGVDHTRVPVGDPWSIDAGTNEVRIPIFLQRDGRFYLDENGDVAKGTLRRVMRRPIPWRRPVHLVEEEWPLWAAESRIPYSERAKQWASGRNGFTTWRNET